MPGALPTGFPALDTVNLPHAVNGRPGLVKIIMPFTDPNIVGKFVYHCHILEHEDGGMMATMQVNDLPSGGALLIIVGALGFFGIAFAGVGPEWLVSVAVATLGAGWAWLGYALWSQIGGPAQQPKRVM